MLINYALFMLYVVPLMAFQATSGHVMRCYGVLRHGLRWLSPSLVATSQRLGISCQATPRNEMPWA